MTTTTHEPPTQDPLLRTRDVADLLSLSIDTVRDMVKAGYLPVVIIGAQTWRFRRSDLEEWIDARARAGI